MNENETGFLFGSEARGGPAEKEWPGNYRMQAFAIKSQTEAYREANYANPSDGWIHIELWGRFFALWVFVACRTNAVPLPAEGIAGIDSFCESRFCSRKASNEINGFDGVLPGRSPANFQAVKVKGRGCSGVPRRLRGIL